MKFDIGALMTPAKLVTGYYLILGRWNFMIYKEDPWGQWNMDWVREPKK